MKNVRNVAESMGVLYHVDAGEEEGGLGRESYHAIAKPALQAQVEAPGNSAVTQIESSGVASRVALWDSTVLRQQMAAEAQHRAEQVV